MVCLTIAAINTLEGFGDECAEAASAYLILKQNMRLYIVYRIKKNSNYRAISQAFRCIACNFLDSNMIKLI